MKALLLSCAALLASGFTNDIIGIAGLLVCSTCILTLALYLICDGRARGIRWYRDWRCACALCLLLLSVAFTNAVAGDFAVEPNSASGQHNYGNYWQQPEVDRAPALVSEVGQGHGREWLPHKIFIGVWFALLIGISVSLLFAVGVSLIRRGAPTLEGRR